MKTFKTYRVLNAALGEVSPLAHNVLYYICNNLSMQKTTRAEIDRISIAVRLKLWYDGCGKRLDFQLKKITQCTDELVEKGYLLKDVIFDKNTGKRTVFYAIPDTFIEQQVQKDLQNSSNNCKKNYPTKKDQNIQNIQNTQKDQNTHKNYKTDEDELVEYRNSDGSVVKMTRAEAAGLPF